MEVRMLVHVSGTRDGSPWPEVGGVLTLPDVEGAAYCALGLAEPIAVPAEVAAETAALTTENTTRRVTRPRKAA